jgi:hypothetical protein
MVTMLIWLLWSIGGIAVVNAAALVALCVAYTWHHGLKLMREEWRQARQQSFERLLPPATGRVASPRVPSRRPV